jgi:outer membrane protein OmpA-like peptidoglycan-associated protein
MRNDSAKFVTGLLVMSFLAFGTAIAAPQSEEVEVKGMIMARAGDTMVVKTSNGNTTVVLDDNTKTKDDKGLFGLEKEHFSNTVLIPGLKVDIDGVSGGQGQVIAKTITVDGDDLETAEMIQAGLHPTAQQVAANEAQLAAHNNQIGTNQQNIQTNQRGIASNKQDIASSKQDIATHTQQIQRNMKDIQEATDRFTALAQYDVKGQATVKFAVGSSTISPEDMDQLKQLAQTAVTLNGYIIEVTGYADWTGSAKMNTKLSEDRAKAVITALMQQGNVPVRHIVAPGAMGEYGEAASNETAAGRAENRRVEVKVLVNKGIASN